MLGSAALSLAYVACGRADAYHEDEIKIWDVAAGVALVRAAGGSVRVAAGRQDLTRIVSATNGRFSI
jgi:myo-inositol-1(or 4)-monophosphatase